MPLDDFNLDLERVVDGEQFLIFDLLFLIAVLLSFFSGVKLTMVCS